jgi:micrococcal nuclease
VRVIDGDTIEVDIALGGRQTIRYIGVDTPETVAPNQPVACFGPEATAANKAFVEGKTVYLEKDVSETDRFGRLLRYVYLADGKMVNELLVSGGFAQVSTFPPDVRHQDRFLAAQQAARGANRGLWGGCQSQAPTPTIARPTPEPRPATAVPQVQPTAAPPAPPPPMQQAQPTPRPSNCSSAYPTVCIPAPPPDLDCPQITFRRFQVLPPDPHRFDADGDGIGCET